MGPAVLKHLCFGTLNLTLIEVGFLEVSMGMGGGVRLHPPEKIIHISQTVKASLTKFSDSLRLPIPLDLSLFGAKIGYIGKSREPICSSFWLGAGPYGVGRQCYSLVHMSRQTRQLALALINTGTTVGYLQ